MREALEAIRDRIVSGLALDLSRGGVLSLHDALTEMIDKAEEFDNGRGLVTVLPAPTVQLVPVNALRDILNECLSAALMPFPAPVKKSKRTPKVRNERFKAAVRKARKTSKKR